MKPIITLLALIFSFFSANAQLEKKENIKALKTAFITQELQFTAAEAEKFWPIYNTYEDAINELRNQERKEIKEKLKGEIKNLSNDDAIAILNREQQLRERQSVLENELNKKLTDQIGAIKVLMLKKAEHNFKMQLLKKYKGGKK